MDWFLYDNDLRHERVKQILSQNFQQDISFIQAVSNTRKVMKAFLMKIFRLLSFYGSSKTGSEVAKHIFEKLHIVIEILSIKISGNLRLRYDVAVLWCMKSFIEYVCKIL